MVQVTFQKIFLHSKVARRVYAQFILCALIPIVLMATISYFSVSKQLVQQSEKQLHLASKIAVMTIFERLITMEQELQRLASQELGHHQTLSRAFIEKHLPKSQHFKAVRLLSGSMAEISLSTDSEQMKSLQGGKSLLLTMAESTILPAGIHLLVPLSSDSSDSGFLAGELNPDCLWEENRQQWLNDVQLSVFDQTNRQLIFTSFNESHPFPHLAANTTRHATMQPFEWQVDGKIYLACARPLFLQGNFQGSQWTLVLSESKASFADTISSFQNTFPQTIAITMLVVLLFSTTQIRRKLGPLAELKEGMKKITTQSFNQRVEIHTGDEFEELADSFNDMLTRLDNHFITMKTRDMIDREILSTMDTDKIAAIVISHLDRLGSGEYVGLALQDFPEPEIISSYLGRHGKQSKRTIASATIPMADKLLFSNHRHGLFVHAGKCPDYFNPLFARGVISLLITPIMIKEKFAGLIFLTYRTYLIHHPDDQLLVQQFADQLAVGLENARLVEDLQQLNWGTLTALAKTVDAKSPWTAGHSERVTRLAVTTAKAMNLPPTDIETIHRSALLHDIGKIGIPLTILDKPGRLTYEEYKIICRHPQVGKMILEPISFYRQAATIIEQHHEHFDGKGYPGGLSGEEIVLGARIIAVADVFDSCISDRPYRPGMDFAQVVDIISNGSGSQFDPQVVDAFLQIVASSPDRFAKNSAEPERLFSNYQNRLAS
ncbi:MAG: HD domain-containing protein [Deltaproteobacteria bacterium]|nr:HD domain-containing protein [Candidatus Anaeroferrophillus wilburensis]MBN2887937.1 HD domain-containing protein [Deltaproteobacteria bacterium]